MPQERIDAGAVLLRRLCQADATAIAAAVRASMKHLEPWMRWATKEAADVGHQRARIIEAEGRWDAGTDFIYSVLPPCAETGAAVREGAAVLGTFGLHRRIGPGGIEMGYWIHADHSGRGYGTAAARALTAVALALPGVERVEIHCDAANAASAAIPRRLGYRLDRIEARAPAAPGESGRHLIWVQKRQI